LLAIETANALEPDAVLRLAALLPDGTVTARNLAGKLRLSNAARDRLVDAAETDARIGAALPVSEAKRLIYRLGAQAFRDQLLLQWAASNANADDAAWRALLALAEAWQPPKFALDGNDVMAAGFEEGPEIGVVLREIERWWVEQDFAPDRQALLDRLKEAARKKRG
jgi:poly(A) polymerase